MIANQTRGASAAAAPAALPKDFRRLKWNEVVMPGDYLEDEQRGLEPWQGPGGFRADTFVKPIYRRGKVRLPRTAGKSSASRENS